MSKCGYRSEEPIAYDVYKVPETRYLCRNPKRMEANDRMQSDRFIGDTDCESCPFHTDNYEDNN